MEALVLTEEQQAAVSWLVERLQAGESPVALRGLAGTGKTTLIPPLRQALAAVGIPVSIGSPTHRAAMILKRKGLSDATTLHAQALTPYFTLEYAEAMTWLGAPVPCRLSDAIAPAGLPWLIRERLPRDEREAVRTLKRVNRLYGAKKALESLGITGRDHFDGFGPKLGLGCLVIDEASMLGREQLTLCQQAFPLLCLIGDPGQLPPVRDVRVLDEVPGIDLTQIHRQAADSPILQLAYAARRGEPVWNQFAPVPGAVERWQRRDAATFRETPLLVWRNTTRLECTHAIREALYGGGDGVYVGEPLVCRASSSADRSEGFYNNALFRVVERSVADRRQVTVMPDGSDDADEARQVTVHLEEVDGDRIDPKAVVFRFGYCLTAHTAQGGEWPTVAISSPDLVAYSRFARRKGEEEALRQWTYTALTRARSCVGFLTQHLFTTGTQVAVLSTPEEFHPMDITHPTNSTTPSTPESRAGQAPVPLSQPSQLAPMFVAPLAEADTPFDLPGDAPLTDDIPEVAVPASVVAAIATQGIPVVSNQSELVNGTMSLIEGKMTDWVQAQQTGTLKALDRVYEHMAACLDKIAVANDHAQYQLATALDRLSASGVQISGTPYTATLQAISPQGFPLQLTLQKRSAEELVQALEGVSAWLTAQGYGAVAAERLPF